MEFNDFHFVDDYRKEFSNCNDFHASLMEFYDFHDVPNSQVELCDCLFASCVSHGIL